MYSCMLHFTFTQEGHFASAEEMHCAEDNDLVLL
jgi:hypothetical protein